MDDNHIAAFLEAEDIPLQRRDISKIENLRWLMYNLGIHSNNKERCEEVKTAILRKMRDLKN